MNIVLIGKDYFPSVGGMEQHLLELARGMHQLGHSVNVVNLRTTNDLGLSKEDFVQIQEYCPLHIKNPFTAVSYGKKLHSILTEINNKQKIDIIHWHDLIAGFGVRLWSKNKQVKKVFTNHSSGYLRYRKTILIKKYFSLSIDHCDALIGPSDELVSCSKEDFKKIPTFRYIPNGVDTDRFAPGENKSFGEKLNLPKDRKIIFCPRRLSPKNGVSYLAQAIAPIVKACPKSYFLITGTGEPPEEEIKIRKIIQDSGMQDHVRFLGNVKNNEMPDLYHASDIVVMPSLIEAVSLAALETMSCAKPLVASNVGGLSQLIDHQNTGFLVPPANPDAIAHAVITLLNNEALYKKISVNARQHVQNHYSWKSIVKQTEELYISTQSMKE